MSIFDPIDENCIDFIADRTIDLNNLHIEWLKQPHLCGQYNKLLAQAENDKDKIKQQIEIARVNVAEAKAKLELKIRRTPGDYDVPLKKDGTANPTESWVMAALTINLKSDKECLCAEEELHKAQTALIEINNKIGHYNAAVKAMADKKAALEHEVLLWLRDYFTVPNLPKPAPEDFHHAKEKAHTEMENKLAKKSQDRTPRDKAKTESEPLSTPIRRCRRGRE